MANVFKALSDPTRREILKLLKNKDMNAGEISDQFNMSKPSISKHLDILREAELISSKKQGQFIIYSINTTILQEVLGEFLSLDSRLEDRPYFHLLAKLNDLTSFFLSFLYPKCLFVFSSIKELRTPNWTRPISTRNLPRWSRGGARYFLFSLPSSLQTYYTNVIVLILQRLG